MKFIFVIIYLFLITNSASAAESKAVIYDEVIDAGNKKNGTSTDNTLEKLLSVKGVDTQYEACKKNGSKLDEMSECIWRGLTPDLKKQVQVLYANETNKENSRSPASGTTKSSSNLTSKSKQISVDYMNDPAVMALSKVFQAKLEEAILGDRAAQADKKTIVSVDHAKFIELYKTELGKTIVNAFTSYCIETDDKFEYVTTKLDCKDIKKNDIACPLYILGSDKEKVVADNIKSLKRADLKSSTDTVKNNISERWNSCITSVANVCYTNEADFKDVSSPSNPAPPGKITESITRACVLVDYVKSARKNMIIADDQIKFYNENAKQKTIGIGNFKQLEITDKNSMDATTTLTSREVEDSYKLKNKELEKEIDECVNSSNQIADVQKCKKFISTDSEDKNKAVTEFGLRQFALEKTINDKLDSSKEEVKKYLQEEGYEDKKIDEMLKDDTSVTKVKDEIKARYEAERKAIIATMADKVQKKTTTSDTFDNQKDATKMDIIKKEIHARSDELVQLVHFNNVVSSYLEVETNGTKSRNVASLNLELKNGAKSINGADADQIKEIEKNAKNAGLNSNKTSSKSDGVIDFSVETLNKILRYTNEK